MDFQEARAFWRTPHQHSNMDSAVHSPAHNQIHKTKNYAETDTSPA